MYLLIKFQFVDLLLNIKRLSSRTSPQAGVAIPIKFADSALKSMGIATPVCALARNDTLLLGVRRTSNSSININFPFFAFLCLLFALFMIKCV